METIPYILTTYSTFKLYRSCFGTPHRALKPNNIKYKSFLSLNNEFIKYSHLPRVINDNINLYPQQKIYEFYRNTLPYSYSSWDEKEKYRYIIICDPLPKSFYFNRFITLPIRNPFMLILFLTSILYIYYTNPFLL
jgi:hypothetical protein